MIINFKQKNIDKANLYPWKYKSNNLYEKGEQNGFNFILGTNYYIITTAHKTNLDTKFYIDGTELNKIRQDFNLDLIIFDTIINYEPIINYNTNLNFEEGCIFTNNEFNIVLEFSKIYEGNIHLYGPHVIFIECNMHEDSVTIDEGMSGLPIFNNLNECIGIIDRLNLENNTIDLIPFCNILRAINKSKLCGIYEYFGILDDELIIEKKSNKDDKTIKYRSGTFKKNDIIEKIDNKKIVKGYIYDKNLGINITIYCYILLYKTEKKKTNFLVKRNDEYIKITKYFIPFQNLETIKLKDLTPYLDKDKDVVFKLTQNLILDFFTNDDSNLNLKYDNGNLYYYPYAKKNKIPLNFLDNVNNNNKSIILNI